jgi:hypothetical protein
MPPPPDWTPLTWWRKNVMPKVTKIPTVLLREDDGPVAVGDIVPMTDSDRRVRVCSVVPDAEGCIQVQETYPVLPAMLGLHLREETVVLELTRAEAKAVIAFYQEVVSRPAAIVSEPATGVLEELTGVVK